ncbi:uncharacterized protein LOC127967941 [Carassius gibelio]|uniref:uncharacterized protein LOC127967941 n=1 Tax=Carassius gibelio TaxID=101364 RepID=UPI00227775A1|nr:uncharacterized protein LOC127967941 [Carassius gibelio]
MVLLIPLIFTLFLEVKSQGNSDQFLLTVSPASVQKDSSTVQLRHEERDAQSDFTKNFFPVKNHSPPTTKGTLYSTPTFSINATATEPKTTLATESSTCYETNINPTTETTHPSQPLNVTWNTTGVLKVSTPGENAVHETPRTKAWLILTIAATSGGIFLTGLVGICLCCIRLQQRKKSPVNTSVAAIPQTSVSDDSDANEEHSEENGIKLYHVYCTIPDVAANSHVLYSLAQMPNRPLPV